MENLNEKVYATAMEARAITDKSTVIKDRVFKFIKDCAYEGRSGLEYSFDYEDKKHISSLVDELRAKGYSVELELQEPYDLGFGKMIIKW